MNRFALGPFLGAATSLDPRLIGDPYSSDNRNSRVDGGWLAPRYGFKKLSSGTIPTGFSASYGMFFLAGYDSSYVNQEEYVSVETRSGNTYPYIANKTTGARTQLQGA